MRRQALRGEVIADMSGPAPRPDPYRLPASFVAAIRGGAPGATAKVVIDGERVTMAAGGRTVTLPVRHYRPESPSAWRRARRMPASSP